MSGIAAASTVPITAKRPIKAVVIAILLKLKQGLEIGREREEWGEVGEVE